jgi:hypothetical protein
MRDEGGDDASSTAAAPPLSCGDITWSSIERCVHSTGLSSFSLAGLWRCCAAPDCASGASHGWHLLAGAAVSQLTRMLCRGTGPVLKLQEVADVHRFFCCASAAWQLVHCSDECLRAASTEPAAYCIHESSHGLIAAVAAGALTARCRLSSAKASVSTAHVRIRSGDSVSVGQRLDNLLVKWHCMHGPSVELTKQP